MSKIIEIRIARNGVSVSCKREDTGQSMDYVYDNLKKALKEIPGMVSVLSDEMPETTESDLEKEEKEINKKAKKKEDY